MRCTIRTSTSSTDQEPITCTILPAALTVTRSTDLHAAGARQCVSPGGGGGMLSRSGPYTGTLKEAKKTIIAMESKIKDKRASSDAKAPMAKESTPSNGSAAAAREVSAQKSPRKRRKVNHGKSRALFQKSSVAAVNCLGQCDHELVSHCGLAYHLIDAWSNIILSFLPSATGVVTWLTHYTPLQLASTVAVR